MAKAGGPGTHLHHGPHRSAEVDRSAGAGKLAVPAEASESWVKCRLTITLPNGSEITREALGGYPDMPSAEDRVKGGDSDAFKRSCVLFGVAEYLYGDDPTHGDAPERPERSQERAPAPAARPTARPAPAGPREVSIPRGDSSQEGPPKFNSARAFYAWVKEHGHFPLVNKIAKREGLPEKIIDWEVDVVNVAQMRFTKKSMVHEKQGEQDERQRAKLRLAVTRYIQGYANTPEEPSQTLIPMGSPYWLIRI